MSCLLCRRRFERRLEAIQVLLDLRLQIASDPMSDGIGGGSARRLVAHLNPKQRVAHFRRLEEDGAFCIDVATRQRTEADLTTGGECRRFGVPLELQAEYFG